MFAEWILEQGRCFRLLVSLLVLLLLYPYLEGGQTGRFVLVLLYSAIPLMGIRVTDRSRGHWILPSLAAAPMVVFAWISLFLADAPLLVAFWVSAALFFVYTTLTMFTYVVHGSEVTRDKIYAAVSVYLLLGLSWFAVYSVVETLQPGSFRGVARNSASGVAFSDLLYYSFVTLTTLGYGEITPATSQARSLAALEAVAGVLYVATFVARLIGLYRPAK